MQAPIFFTRSFRHYCLVVLCGIGAVLPLAASAMSIRELHALEKSDSKQGANYKRYYLVGVMEGVLAAHDQGVRDGAKPSICINGRRIAPSMAEGLYQTELQRNHDLYEADMPAPLVVANALATVYPC